MKLKAIRIEKFRSIRQSEIKVKSELAIVGQNSAGENPRYCVRSTLSSISTKSVSLSKREPMHFKRTQLQLLTFVSMRYLQILH